MRFATIGTLVFALLPSSIIVMTPAWAQAVRPPSESVADANGCKMWDQSWPAEPSITWSGACKDGYLNGKGILETFSSGKLRDRYEGEIKDGYYDGQGTYFWASGNRYDGTFRHGYFHGHAVFTSANGNRFVGEYQDDRRTRGVMTWASGARYDGEWSGDKAHGRGTYTAKDGSVYAGTWTNGCFREGNRRAAIGIELDKCP